MFDVIQDIVKCFNDNVDDTSSIISKELFALAMDRLEKNKYAPSIYKADERYLLSTKLICGCCGATMVGESGTGRNDKKYHYYKCQTPSGKRTVRSAQCIRLKLREP